MNSFVALTFALVPVVLYVLLAVTVSVLLALSTTSWPAPLSVTLIVTVFGVVSYVMPPTPPSVSVIVKLYVPALLNWMSPNCATLPFASVAFAVRLEGIVTPS